MTQRNYNKTHVKRILQTLNQWVKKPSLEHDLSGILDEYQAILNNGEMNFSEVAIFIQSFSIIFEKKVDILTKEFFALSFRLCDALRRPEKEQNNTEIDDVEASDAQQQNVQSNPEPQKNKVQEEEKEKPPEKPKRKRRSKKDQTEEKKKIIPGLPKELFSDILQSLNLSECNINDIVQECLNQLTPTHPLYSVFAKIGDEISRTKNLITYKDISLSGKAWNILYLLENLLNKYKPLSTDNNLTENQVAENEETVNKIVDENGNMENTSVITESEVTNTAILTDSGIGTSLNPESEVSQLISSGDLTATCTTTMTESHIDDDNRDNSDELTNPVDVNIVETSLQVNSNMEINNIKNKFHVREVRINLLRLPSDMLNPIKYFKIPAEYLKSFNQKSFSDAQLRKIVADRCKIEIKDVRVNLFQLPLNILLKVETFKLPKELTEEKKRKRTQTAVMTRKRQKAMEKECKRLVKRLKSYDLQAYENFCQSQNSTNDENPVPLPETAVPVSETGVSVSETADVLSETTLPVSETAVPVSETIIPVSETGALVSETNEKSEDTSAADKVYQDRKSIDQRSEMSYGYPVTPDSGHFSLSHIDSENEHTDFDIENDELRRNSSRATSVMMSPHYDNMDSGFSEQSSSEAEDPTLKKLKKMFPNSFADPSRAEFLKSLVQPPEKEKETEEYREWKSFIDHKTAKDAEFNIYEYGTRILNSFPTKTEDEIIGFSSVVKGKSVRDMSRFFVSALQLANTYNVEICDERVEGEVNSEGFNLKFLSEERPEPELEETHLPPKSIFEHSIPSTSFARSTPFRSRDRSPFYNINKTKRRKIDFIS